MRGKLNFLFLAIFFICLFSVYEATAQDCNYWYAAVGVKGVNKRAGDMDKNNPDNIIKAAGCLLKLEGDKSRGAFSGATNFQVSELLPPYTVEICALYYISWLFYENYEHASGIALVDESNLKLNSKRLVTAAYKSYRKWLEKVKEIGLEKARKQKFDPLEGSVVRWY